MAAGLLRTARDKAKLTQQQLGERAGVTQQAISAYETGRKEPTMRTLVKLLEAAGFEMRIQLARLDGHDESVAQFLASLPPGELADLEEARRRRVEEARLRRVRGN